MGRRVPHGRARKRVCLAELRTLPRQDHQDWRATTNKPPATSTVEALKLRGPDTPPERCSRCAVRNLRQARYHVLASAYFKRPYLSDNSSDWGHFLLHGIVRACTTRIQARHGIWVPWRGAFCDRICVPTWPHWLWWKPRARAPAVRHSHVPRPPLEHHRSQSNQVLKDQLLDPRDSFLASVGALCCMVTDRASAESGHWRLNCDVFALVDTTIRSSLLRAFQQCPRL